MSENQQPDPQQPDEVSEQTRQEIDEAMAGAQTPAEEAPVESSVAEPADRVTELEALVAERTLDLQRLQAEYVNYKRRVDRDRQMAKQQGAEGMVRELMPVLDGIHMAREHDELTGGFKMVADEIGKVAEKHGLVAFGEVGDEFDPNLHDALMQVPLPGATSTCVSQVMQRGYQMNGRVLRPARVAVSEPDPTAAGEPQGQPAPQN
ncbi:MULTISPECIES: nucleotide exchange factor GrpE [unclassified Luteococcus]|uniref:nucleotide exchange factor GrpE n=1 Tax=unclassified Luteococcus TaxID=2639923 RepID=UPI00313DB026